LLKAMLSFYIYKKCVTSVINTLIEKPQLNGIFTKSKDPSKITTVERNYIQQVIMQMYLVYTATKLGQFDTFNGIENDIKKFLNFPLQASVWEEIKEFHDREFVEYIERLQSE